MTTRSLFARARGAALGCALLHVVACGSSSSTEGGPDGGPGAGDVGEPELWLELDVPALDLAADASHLYFCDGYGVRRVALTGGEPEALYEISAPGESYFWSTDAIYLSSTHVALVWSATELVTPYRTERHLVVIPKRGGDAVALASSADVRSFLGVYIHGDEVYFSTFTSILRVPLVGGDVELAAESPGSISYWIYSPIVNGDELVWASDDQLFHMPLNDPDKEGQSLAGLPGVGKIIDHDANRYVVALSPAIAFQEPADAFVVIDAATGAVGDAIPLTDNADDFAVAGPDLWVARWAASLSRMPLAGGPTDLVLDQHVLAVAAANDAVFAATETALWRIPLGQLAL